MKKYINYRAGLNYIYFSYMWKKTNIMVFKPQGKVMCIFSEVDEDETKMNMLD